MHLMNIYSIKRINPRILSWALYDVANTLFSMNIVSLYFALWAVNVIGIDDALYGNVNAFSMLMVFILAPFLGALSDQSNRRIPFLAITAFLCSIFTLFLGVGGIFVSLMVFAAANFMAQAGLIFYDSLLPTVSNARNVGKVGSFGIGIGYIGSFLGIAMGIWLLEVIGYVGIFRLTAVIYFIFTIPCFLFVRDVGGRPLKLNFSVMKNAWLQMMEIIANTSRFPGLRTFLISRVFYADAVNTLLIFIGIYVTNDIGLSQTQVQGALLVAIASSMLSCLVWGTIVDRYGPKRILKSVLLLWMLVLVLMFAIPVLNLPISVFWVTMNLGGIALGGTWSSDRPFLLTLSPDQYVGGFFGLYSMVGRFSSVGGPFIWGFVSHTLNLGRPVSVLVLLVFVIISFALLTRIKDRSPLIRE